MLKSIISLGACLILCSFLSGCATSADPIQHPPAPGAASDQVTGTHRALTPLYQNELKNPPPYVKHDHHKF